MQSFVKIKSSRNGEITLSITDICKSCASRGFLASQMCLLTLFVKLKFSQKFPDLQYTYFISVFIRRFPAEIILALIHEGPF